MTGAGRLYWRHRLESKKTLDATLLGFLIFLGLSTLGYLASSAALKIKEMDRVVTVKGLAEREVEANVAIWPIRFNEASNDLAQLYAEVEKKSGLVVDFLQKNGFAESEITVNQPAIFDRQSQNYGDTANVQFRYTAAVTINVYSFQVQRVRDTMKKMLDLGKEGIAISGQDYETKTEFLYTDLNKIKPQMIEEATNNAREVAQKFATDSQSKLGKIKNASQGQFSIDDRDSSTKHIKRVRVVSTIEYYLSD